MNSSNKTIVDTLHISFDDVPWVRHFAGLETRVLQARPEENLVVTQVRAAANAAFGWHRHLAPLYAVTSEGAWGHSATDFPYRPGTYVYEPAHVTHRFFNGPARSTALFIITGLTETLDDDGNEVIARRSILEQYETYMQKCEALGLPRPNVLT